LAALTVTAALFLPGGPFSSKFETPPRISP
jgi:hypothetical protein